ncbi:hypothetical protein [Paenibacillus montanisoli]|uniref:Uncharacterized protein n=1 Tax=Paenibacillus montanisoli TaxID=2081970 RepID=A0A328TXX7_9BACL|nr:hypothetical protein [Paenibacillus montanisoli]RAP75300.1 hypothetical protein DL346_18175 [Paenibacillus montanisoli]
MTDKERFHCVRCGCMMESMDAAVLFQTGFYRVILPLGCCKTCYTQTQETLPQDDVKSAAGIESALSDELKFTTAYNYEQPLAYS